MSKIKFVVAILIAAVCVRMPAVSVAARAERPFSSASSMAVLEVNTGRVLYESNSAERRPMASTTKILTAIVAIENARLGEIVTVDARAQGVEGSSVYLRGRKDLYGRFAVLPYAAIGQ